MAVAREMGREIASRGMTLVYGGAKVGVMGAVAEGALEAKGRVVGVIPKSLVTKEIAHDNLTELYLTESMHERKNRMIELSDAFVSLPGGFGTYDELFETITLIQTGKVENFPILLYGKDYWGPTLAQIDRMVAEGTLKQQELSFVFVADSVEEATTL